MIQIADTIKILDIVRESVSDSTINYLTYNHIGYEDKALKEHLISIYDASEAIPETSFLYDEVQELQTLAANNDAAYIRFI